MTQTSPKASAPSLLERISIPEHLRTLPESDLVRVAEEVRRETIECVSTTGGHLGAGLGVVELTVALHYVFDTPKDRLIWDVGHQAYPHKILTGRREGMRTLRQPGGLSGFTKRSESEYDPFGAAHSSTSISSALGFAEARDLAGEDHNVIAVIGDGAITAGMAYEGLNNAGASKARLIVILNDNNMSIGNSTGAMSDYFNRLTERSEGGSGAASGGEKAPGIGDNRPETTFFEEIGFDYIGPVDGHDLDKLVAALKAARNVRTGPVLVHVVTEKGYGYTPAAGASDRMHGVVKFDPLTGAQVKPKAAAPSYTKVFGEALVSEAQRDPRVVAITAAMPSGTGVDIFAKAFPERAYDVGIAEQHAVTFAAGMAASGYKPFCAIYSTFLQRAYDQIVHDVALQKLPVRFAIDRAGLVGADGPTHAGSFDLAYLGCLPNMVIMAASDEAELVNMVATAVAYDEGPIAFRYPRGEGIGVPLPEFGTPMEIGRGRILREGSRVALLSLGTRLAEALKAADILAGHGVMATVADARFAKPIDTTLVRQLATEHEFLITIEEGSIGGFGSQVTHFLMDDGLLDSGKLKVRTLVLPDEFQNHDNPERMYAQAQLDAAGLAKRVLQVLARQDVRRVRIPA